MIDGNLLIFSGPSGAGKTTLIRHLLAKFPQLEFSVSACSRAPRHNEVDGRDYHFLSPDEFRNKVKHNEFVEWEEVYTDHFYGTLWSELRRIWSAGHVVLFDVDVKGGINLKQQFPSTSLAVFVMPPSVEVLRERLLARCTDKPEKIEMRLAKALQEMELADRFDRMIVNDRLEDALLETEFTVNQWLTSI